MKAVKILHEKLLLHHKDKRRLAVLEFVIWDVGMSTDYSDGIKFRAWLSENGVTLFGLDNHKPKGPHLHWGDRELTYEYKGIEQLRSDILRFIELENFIYED